MSRRKRSTNESRKPKLLATLNTLIFLMLYSIIRIASPASTVMHCSLTTSTRLCPSASRRDEDENMQTIESRKSISTIIQTTLSPSKRSANDQNDPAFFFAAIS